jgi:cytoplasmic iron level regulating protein YaaA (DUF328/UPF0246 family)
MKTLFLIPPSEGKNSEDKINKNFEEVFSELSFGKVNSARKEIINYLEIMDFNQKNLEKMTGLKGKNVEEAYKTNKNLLASKVKKTIDLFNGVMFKSIDYSNMEKQSKKFFEENFAIFNALLGVNKPLDLIPEFKVKPEGYIEKTKIHRFWKEKMDDVFEEYVVFDLLTSNYRKMVDNSEFYKVDFYSMKKGELKSAGHFSKKYRGQLINYICKNNIKSLDTILNIKTKNLELYDYDKENKEIKMIIRN